jgi:diguanylate cyclase (GGDEF)-like protein
MTLVIQNSAGVATKCAGRFATNSITGPGLAGPLPFDAPRGTSLCELAANRKKFRATAKEAGYRTDTGTSNAENQMLKPPLPLNETQRLLSLHSLRLLDTPEEERFDRITRMAKRMFDVQSCLISLVDTNRQWFKSKQGLDACETSRDVSFCGHAILGEDVFVVGDAAADPRFEDNPLVTGDPRIRFYAGCPVRSPDGQRIGTLCLIDKKPRGFPPSDQEILRDLAALVEDELRVTTQATVDELTKIANRRGFNTVAGHLLSLCRRTNTEAEMIFFDLDKFKEVNDTHGHQAGDRVLQGFARLLIKCFRSADVVARLGGDEFVVLMTASGNSSKAAIERLQEYSQRDDSDILSQLRWSVGSVSFDPLRHDSVDSMLADADSRMYRNKFERRAADG